MPARLRCSQRRFAIQWSRRLGRIRQKTGRRLAFAKWMTNPDHPLTSRVMVNRIWQHHFGTGIVKSLGNFGKTGAPPTNPELLDWLAYRICTDRAGA